MFGTTLLASYASAPTGYCTKTIRSRSTLLTATAICTIVSMLARDWESFTFSTVAFASA